MKKSVVLFVVWLLAVVVSVLGCGDEYPSCPIEGGGVPGDGEQGPEPDHDPAPGPQDPWPGGDGLSDDEGYKRLGDGQICRCNLDADELCSRTEPVIKTSDAACDVSEPEGDPDCAGWAAPDGVCDLANPADVDCNQAEPEQYTPTTCGNTFWCCYTIECVGYETETRTDVEFCPEWFGKPNATRYIAYDTYYRWVVLFRRNKLRKKYHTKACYIWEANCQESRVFGPICGSYPM